MPRWKPEQKWLGCDAFIIGGGRSLGSFNYELLRSELTIGCNSRFRLGPEICKMSIIGDEKFFNRFRLELEDYAKRAPLFTNCTNLLNARLTWLWTMRREAWGLHFDALGWNGNTGASAINLALILGAKRVFLLGFDMKLIAAENSPDYELNPATQKPEVYRNFAQNFRAVARDWQKKFADREIINLTKDSDLDVFPKVDLDQFWAERGKDR